MNQTDIVHAFYTSLYDFESNSEWIDTIEKAYQYNKWFEPENIRQSLQQWQFSLSPEQSKLWLDAYHWNIIDAKTVGIIMAGNIPLVGFHDFICALCAGYNVKVKLSSDDNVLLKYWFSKAIQLLPELNNKVEFTDSLKNIDAAIATGSNNSARYFEYYFRSIPHILRKNRNSLAVLSGHEKPEDLVLLGHDTFDYFGMGCRNITHLLLPNGYEFRTLFEPWETFYWLINHNKYANNYNYHKALLLMNLDPHLDNGFVLMKESELLYSPVGMLNYSYYNSELDVNNYIKDNADAIQCVVTELDIPNALKPGNAQKTTLLDYADGVDVVQFLLDQQS